MQHYDFLIVGGGIIGLSIARELACRHAGARIALLEKEREVAAHASGRNSGVLHAGFYYSADSLKAKFTVEGNRLMTEYCLDNGLKIRRCGKVVVAKDQGEVGVLEELERRGRANGVDLKVVDERELAAIEPNARTFGRALHSPTTSSVDPAEVCRHIASHLPDGVQILRGTAFIAPAAAGVLTSVGEIGCGHLINAAGLYADRVAHGYGVGFRYAMVPFKGMYLKYSDSSFLKVHVYPVPNLGNPFLGVHFTKAVDGAIKLGPTAMPAFWRENYGLWSGFRIGEFSDVVRYTARLLFSKPTFRRLALKELCKRSKRCMVRQSLYMVRGADRRTFDGYLAPGIRAQLVDRATLDLVDDFKVEAGERSTHVLNAVSPAFTCAFSFARHVADMIPRSLN